MKRAFVRVLGLRGRLRMIRERLDGENERGVWSEEQVRCLDHASMCVEYAELSLSHLEARGVEQAGVF